MPINQQSKNLQAFPPFTTGETHIYLNTNQISEIPPHIENAINLTHLYVGHNKLTEIPVQVCKLKKLSILILNHNEISQLPSQIGDLTSLTQLRLQNNKLSELPKEIGNLTNLTHLFLDNNQITYLPEEIKNLKNLVHLSLVGNPITLPKTYAANRPHDIITFILEQQGELSFTDSTIITKAYYFTNGSKETITKKYISIISSLASDKKIEFISIESANEITNDTNLVFIIAPIDSHDNEKLIFDIARNCKKLGTRFFILIQDKFLETDFDSINLSKWNTFETTKDQLQSKFSSECKSYSSYDEFRNLISGALKQHKPNIRLSKLILENIGHFSNFEISFDKDLTCLIGENGTGKSTILRALALAIIGPDHKKIEERTKRGFLKILQFEDDHIKYEDGLIRLEYFIDGDRFTNELKLVSNDNGNDISIISSGNSHIVFNKYNLKSLIVGFPQARGNEASDNADFIANKITQPHVSDLMPLINNSDDYRLRLFSGWIANLYFDSIKNKEKNNSKNKEEVLIEKAFEIISDITKKEMKFKTVTKIDPPDVWVSTYDSPKGVPLNLISQGFKIVIGWIGYLLHRFVNTFPLSDPNSAFKENAIVIIDEVDISMHPVWQLSFIEILKKTFPNTQFIFTTHDPLLIGSLIKEQVRVFQEKEGLINVIQPEIDPKGLGVAGILTSELFGLPTILDEETMKELEEKRRLQVLFKEDKLSEEQKKKLIDLEDKLEKYGFSKYQRDPVYQKFIFAYMQREELLKAPTNKTEKEKQNRIMVDILDGILKEESKS